LKCHETVTLHDLAAFQLELSTQGYHGLTRQILTLVSVCLMARKRKRPAVAIEIYRGEEDDDDEEGPTNRNLTFSRLNGRLAQTSGDVPANDPAHTSNVEPDSSFHWFYDEDNTNGGLPDAEDLSSQGAIEKSTACDIVSLERYLFISLL
jgi:hypothetical protein